MTMDSILALKVHDKDNVATIFSNDVKAGCRVNVIDKKGNSTVITVRSDIPYGHKVAVAAVPKGNEIFKYGESIGAAAVNIMIGDYVHVHNLDSLRGRGDL